MNKNNKKIIHRYPRFRHRQSGYIVILTVVLLAALLVSSLSFFERTADSMQMTGYNRDSAESLLLAESAMNQLYGQFLYDPNFDVDGDGNLDNTERVNLDDLANLPLPYMYFASTAGNQIDREQPEILQMIANGESSNTSTAINGHEIGYAANRKLTIADLFTAPANPIVYTLNANSRLQQQNNNAWTNNTVNRVAVTWIELVSNPAIAGNVQVYIQAAARVGRSKSYVQRLIGSYPTTLGNNIGPINQAG